ncbi:MAG: GtrA family protein [Negativicutes bacterium]|nr:GtrA family protein [Negativicutes bacterium]
MNYDIKKFINKYKTLIFYLFFGIITTFINLIIYHILYTIFTIPNIFSTAIAWIFAVIFAYLTNKLWVFNSKAVDGFTLKHEISTFFAARILTGILDVVIMYAAVDVLRMNATIWKLISNILVVILNYAASKLIIFRKK